MPHRRRFTVMLAALLVLGVLGAPAWGRRGAHGAPKRAIMTAAGVRAQAPIGCFRVYVSSVNSTWASTTYGGATSKPCLDYAADGVSVTHFTRGRWRFVTAGSAFSCPIPGHIPVTVQHDLRLVCRRG